MTAEKIEIKSINLQSKGWGGGGGANRQIDRQRQIDRKTEKAAGRKSNLVFYAQ